MNLGHFERCEQSNTHFKQYALSPRDLLRGTLALVLGG